MGWAELERLLGDGIEDPEEGIVKRLSDVSTKLMAKESFLLFSSPIPSSNLGFVDSKAKELSVSINGQDLAIQQSPGLLHANLPGGTTGAVLWKVSPLFAAWISNTSNAIFGSGVLSSASIIIEMGTGVSGLVALSLAPCTRKYIATDQNYVLKALRGNIASNSKPLSRKKSDRSLDIDVLELDWEDSNISQLSRVVPETQRTASLPGGFDAVIACDCIYNESLIPSFVNTCGELCSLRTAQSPGDDESYADKRTSPTVCIVAQQLRSSLVFEEWLRQFHEKFKVWRIPDEVLSADLREGSGFVVHIGVLRQPIQESH